VAQAPRAGLPAVAQLTGLTVGRKLRGKIHIWVGDADQDCLNEAVHCLDALLQKAETSAEVAIVYGPGKVHFWRGIIDQQMIEQMLIAVNQRQNLHAK
jgi:hypothetical protein